MTSPWAIGDGFPVLRETYPTVGTNDGPCSRSLDFPVHASCWECACRRPVLHARVSALRGGGLLLSSPLGLQGRLLVDMAMDFCADSSCYHVLAYSYG